MHWALGEAEMCRRANVLPFPSASTNRPEAACAPAPSAGRVAQRDRMRGSTRVFEGQDITTITSPGFHSVNGNGNSNCNPQSYVPYSGGPGVPSPINLPSISNGQSFPGYVNAAGAGPNGDDDENDDNNDGEGCCDGADNEQQQREGGGHVRKKRLGNGTRLPGLAELDRTIAAEIAASEGGRLVTVKQEGGGGGAGGGAQQQQSCSRRIKHEHGRKGSVGSGVSSRRSG